MFGTWCHRHAWHAELWRDRLPSVVALNGEGDDVEAWIRPLRTALADVSTSEEAIAAFRESVLPALEAAVAEHRDAIDPLLDGPTARVLDLVAADLAAERTALPHPSVSGHPSVRWWAVLSRNTRMGWRQVSSAIAAGGGHRPSRLYAHHSNGLE